MKTVIEASYSVKIKGVTLLFNDGTFSTFQNAEEVEKWLDDNGHSDLVVTEFDQFVGLTV